MNNTSEKLLQIKDELLKLEKQKEKLLKERQRIIDNCEHEINFITCETESSTIKGKKTRSYTKCLICGRYLWPTKAASEDTLRKMKNAIKIDMHNYPNYAKKRGEDCYRIVKIFYNIEKKYNPELTEFEIGNRLIKILEKIENEEKAKQE